MTQLVWKKRLNSVKRVWLKIKLQYTTDCALRMMVCLAGEGRVVSSRELEEKTEYPQQSIFNAGRKLKKAGLVNTVSGPFGGYILAGRPADISFEDILRAFRDTFSITENGFAKKTKVTTLRNSARLLEDMEADIVRRMSELTLADLLAGKAPDQLLTTYPRQGHRLHSQTKAVPQGETMKKGVL